MFRCQKTGKVSAPGEKPFRIVIETRDQTYINYPKDPKKDPKTSHGWEIVRELLVCKEVAEQMLKDRAK